MENSIRIRIKLSLSRRVNLKSLLVLYAVAQRVFKLLPLMSIAFTLLLQGANDGDILARARELATSKHRPGALDLLEKHLEKSSNDVDARLLYGLILSWEGRYDEAREQLGRVLMQAPAYRDARIALINVELWSGHPARAEQTAREGLVEDPHDADFLFATARALRAQKRNEEAGRVIKELLEIDPANVKARGLRDSIRDDPQPWSASFDYSQDRFSNNVDLWHEYQLQLRRSTPAGPVLARVQRADRFGLHSNQVEVDFYPHIRTGTYAYLNLGFSPDSVLYPRYRTALDLYQSFGDGYEASGGFRRLGFTGPVNIYTTWIGKYYGNWLFGGRCFFTPYTVGTTASVYLSARHYSGALGDYISFRLGRGSTPLEISTVTDLAILNSTSGEVEYYKTYRGNLTLGIRAGLSRENRVGRGIINHYSFNPNIAFRF